MEQTLEKRWVDLYLSNEELLNEGASSVIVGRRSEALEMLNLYGIPTKGSALGDRYHYTDLRSVYNREYEHYFTPSYTDADPVRLPLEGYRITFINGFCCDPQPLTRMENGIIYGSLAEAARHYPELVIRYYAQLSREENDPVAALTAVFMQDGAFIYLPAGVKSELPFLVESAHTAEGEAVASFGRNLFVFEQGAEAELVLDYHTLGTCQVLSTRTREVWLAEEARVELVELCRMNEASCLVTGSYVKQERSSHYQSTTLALSGELVRANQRVELAAPGAENHTNGLILSAGESHLDMTTEIDHRSPHCTSRELVKTIATDQATAVFTGRIHVARDAQQTQAFQENNNLLLSDDARVYTKPQLEIYADDVKCSHGATIGQLDEEGLYYMRQRGIGVDEARRLQMYGFARDVIAKTGIEPLADFLEQEMVARIDGF